MCQNVDLGGGNFAIICGTRRKPRYCACGRECDFLCDWKVKGKKSGTCDAPICIAHSKQVAPNKHLCPLHQKAFEEWKKRHPSPQQNLFTEASA